MPIFPYKVRPVPPLVAVLLEDGETVLTEEDGAMPIEQLPQAYRVWGDWDLITRLWGDGVGEALCWRLRPVRWRHTRQRERGWKPRHTDVRVLRVDWPKEDDAKLAGLVGWRDWLGAHGAAPQGSMGSTSMSLLRATLTRPVWTAQGQLPPVKWIMGGRQELIEQGRFEPARHYDLPAAYAQELGGMKYGGAWAEVGGGYPYRMVAQRGILCFVRARVRVPSDLQVGPLPRRPRRPPRQVDALLSFSRSRYPVGTTVQGVWTWEEVAAAEEAGCKVRVLQVWVHSVDKDVRPFGPWFETVLEGRSLEGFAGHLAKATGNALWGQFCLSGDAERTVDHWQGSRAQPQRYKRAAPLPGRSPWYAPDLAETLTGRVRAALFKGMLTAGTPPLLCAHTDGIWTAGVRASVPEGWRAKEKAARLDVLTPQFIRYYRTAPPVGEPEYVVAGAPATLAPALFDQVWQSMASSGRVPE